ncbi:MAG: indolepyruvate ferredoxin oxidoreductase family protein [Xanthobacteraceae bacterium]|nr:MAG: indolepyruvate ferredoxin oxidoreductase family protein [Xanthobacteraceae bacterium]
MTTPTTKLLKRDGEPSLDEARYETRNGRVLLSGTQALIRLPIEQMRRDAAAGLRTKAFITGYPGSPLGGYDIALKRAAATLDRHGIKHVPGQNEELAISALIGTQMLDSHPHPDVDGVVGFWYGKGPGIDRSSDAIKHGNFGGTSRNGAVVILSGEDHEAKSSSVPYQQEFAFEHYGVPVLYPASITEFIEFGLHAVALSRFSGCWVALKLVAPLCDGGEVVQISEDSTPIVLPDVTIDGRPFSKSADFTFFPVLNVATEQRLYAERHRAVVAYAEANNLNRIVVMGERNRIGIISAGKSFADTRQALINLGFDDDGLKAAGIRLAKVGLLCPSSPEFFRQFAKGLDHVIVVEEKRDFLERQVGAALCGFGAVRVVGKIDLDGQPLFPVAGGMDVDIVTELLGGELKRHLSLPEAAEARLRRIATVRAMTVPPLRRRTPNYCSGCPHNVSTRLAPGQMAWGAPGCHVFAALMEQPERRIEAMTQFGGEGMPWIGLSPYTTRPHIVQNVGDGSLFHSSLQNIRFAVSTGQAMTFRILYNGVIANTGGQSSVNQAPVVSLLHRLAADGVVRTILVARNKHAYAGLPLPANVSLREPHEVQAAMAELERIKGVTVLIYDGDCANERRRRQKRGRVAPTTKFTIVNEDVCDNCGDCGRKANCMSLQKTPTQFGLKTQIHQSSCNQDRSCVEGECPSFVSVTVKAGTSFARPPMPDLPADMLEPALPTLDRPFHIYIPGVGGTGVITVNAILAQAAAMDGHEVKSFDQTGAAQKWGAVLSSIILSKAGEPIVSNKVTAANADLYLAFDLLAATDKTNLAVCDSERTAAVINTDILPTGEMIRNINAIVDSDAMTDVIAGRIRPGRKLCIPARTAAERIFGDYMMTNMVVIGVAYQAGLLPISAASIERSITLNGTAAKVNIMAFRAGRLFHHDPERFARMLKVEYGTLADRIDGLAKRETSAIAAQIDRVTTALEGLPPEAKQIARNRVADLVAYKDERYAMRFARAVADFSAADRAAFPGDGGHLTSLVIRNLHKIMAYKDEYEVARLLTDPVFEARVRTLFPGFEAMAFNLQPPFARIFGLNRKVEFGSWFRIPLRLLARLRKLRGTILDPFMANPVRREERSLVAWYISLVETCARDLASADKHVVAELLNLPDEIRGYESIKMEGAATARAKAIDLLARLHVGAPMMASQGSKRETAASASVI